MRIEKILAGIKEQAPKSEAAPVKIASEQATAAAALEQALNTPAPEKVAAVTPSATPTDGVAKLAAEVLASEKEFAIKHAEELGRAFANSAVAQFAAWQKEAAALNAQEEKLKQAAQYGFEQGQAQAAQNEKTAEEDYNRGWNETVEAIHKTAADEFLKGAAVAAQLADAAAE